MIRIERKENKVLVKVEHGIFHAKEYFELEINQAYEYQAELLREAIQKNLNNHLIKIKEDYYNKGWKDAKAKGKKRTDFWGGDGTHDTRKNPYLCFRNGGGSGNILKG